MALGREFVPWGAETWNSLDQAVHDEFRRAGVAATLVPLSGPFPDAQTVPALVVDRATMTVDEAMTRPLVEISVSFGLRQEQVADPNLATAVTLATQAAHLLSQAEDALVFRGEEGKTGSVFDFVACRGDAGRGLLSSDDDVIKANMNGGGAGEAIFRAVVEGRARLQARGHYGPYALALDSMSYANAFAPVGESLALPADRIAPLVAQGFVSAGALPESTGVLFSVGGATVDIAVGSDPATAFSQVDPDGTFRFRVFERFALRIKDAGAVLALKFGG
jgi:uncharacterized linocin/CFP29 family protein